MTGIVDKIKNAIGLGGYVAPDGQPLDQPYPAWWHSVRELRRDRLADAIRDMTRAGFAPPAEDVAELDRVNRDLAAARAHDLRIERAHAATCNAFKEKQRQKASAS